MSPLTDKNRAAILPRMKFPWPIVPNRGIRGIDPPPWGSGGYHAPRQRSCADKAPTCPACKGTGRVHCLHDGLDFLGEPGDLLQGFFEEALVTHKGVAYTTGDLGSIHLQGQGSAAGYSAKVLYCALRPTLKIGSRIAVGDAIATVQDVAGYHASKSSASTRMSNHVHLKLYLDSEEINPSGYFLG